jgi:hypothetical protein
MLQPMQCHRMPMKIPVLILSIDSPKKAPFQSKAYIQIHRFETIENTEIGSFDWLTMTYNFKKAVDEH